MEKKVWKADLALPKDAAFRPKAAFWIPLDPLALMIPARRGFHIEMLVQDGDAIDTKLYFALYMGALFNPTGGILLPYYDSTLSVHFPMSPKVVLSVDHVHPTEEEQEKILGGNRAPEVNLIMPSRSKAWPWDAVCLHPVEVTRSSPREAAQMLVEYTRYKREVDKLKSGHFPGQPVPQ